MMVAAIALATFAATFLGGLFALKLRDKLHLIIGFSAGAIVGVAFFDLLPEAISLGSLRYDPATILSVSGIGFVAYLVLDRLILLHGHEETPQTMQSRSTAGAGSLSLHSLLDGIGIGLAFQVSAPVGIIVAAAVLTHDFSDGINTVSFILKGGGTKQAAFQWLIIDALAPVLGVGLTRFFTIQESSLALLLALFAGFFLYIGAGELIPESHHAHPKRFTTVMTVLGMLAMYIVVRVASF